MMAREESGEVGKLSTESLDCVPVNLGFICGPGVSQFWYSGYAASDLPEGLLAI